MQSLAQSLFEAGLITYIRTDAESLSVEFLNEAESFYTPIYKEVYLKREYKAGKQSQAEAHEAIRITHPHTYENLESVVYNASITNQDALKLYQLIFERTIESQGKNAIYDKQDLLFKIKNEYFKCSVKSLKSAGFLAMFSKKELENDESNDDKDNKEKDQNAQFNLKIDDVLSLNDLVLATIKRNAPSPYKEAGFVKLLENKGIGRPSTYATYLPTLLKREYINISQDKKHTITPTHKGKRVVEVFENAYQFIIDLTYTKQMEEVLDEIVENKSSYVDFISNLSSKCPKIEKLERNDDDEIKPSSEGQITYIENILRDLQLELSEEFKNYKEDNRVAKAFLDRYIKEHEFFKKNNKKASSSNNDETRPATPKQISFAESLAKKHHVKLPKDYKSNMKVCGDFINEYHKK